MSRSWILVAAVSSLAVGCISGKGEGDDDTAGSGGSEIDGDGGSTTFDGDGPVASNGIVRCQAGSESSGQIVFVECDYDDPQGPADVESGTLIARQAADGSQVWEKPGQLVCRDYVCQGSFSETQTGYAPVNCAQLANFSFEAVLVDKSGNLSDPLPLTVEAR